VRESRADPWRGLTQPPGRSAVAAGPGTVLARSPGSCRTPAPHTGAGWGAPRWRGWQAQGCSTAMTRQRPATVAAGAAAC